MQYLVMDQMALLVGKCVVRVDSRAREAYIDVGCLLSMQGRFLKLTSR